MAKAFLNEVYMSKLSLVEAKATDTKRPGVLGTVEGPFAEIGTVNRNNRRYTESLWDNKVLSSEYVKEMFENGGLLGEAEHPAERLEPSIPHVSHIITKLWKNEDRTQVMGRADILDTPMGNIVHTLVKYGMKLGISARAVGSVTEKKGVDEVDEEDYTFRTFDFVPTPGFGTSRLSPVTESLEEGNARGMLEELKGQISKLNVNELSVVESVLSTVDKEFYKEIIDNIETLITENRSKDTNPLSEEVSVLTEKVKTLEESNTLLSEQVVTLDATVIERDSAQRELDLAEGEIVELRKANETLKIALRQKETPIINEVKGTSKIIEGALVGLQGKVIELTEKVQLTLTEKQETEKKNKIFIEEIAKVKARSNYLETFVINSLTEEIGVSSEIVSKLLPEGFTVEQLDSVKQQLKESFVTPDVGYKEPVKVSTKEVEKGAIRESLVTLVGSVKKN